MFTKQDAHTRRIGNHRYYVTVRGNGKLEVCADTGEIWVADFEGDVAEQVAKILNGVGDHVRYCAIEDVRTELNKL